MDSETGEQQPFPDISEAPSVQLSVVVPAFDEEHRRKFAVRKSLIQELLEIQYLR